MTVAPREKVPAQPQQYSLILKRLRELLFTQQDRFRLYLEVLNKQKAVIEQGSVEDILVHVELEEKITADILAIQKVIDPLEALYPASKNMKTDLLAGEILKMKTLLEELQQEVHIQIEQNRELLSKRMSLLASEIRAIRESPLRKRTALYANTGTPSFIDLAL